MPTLEMEGGLHLEQYGVVRGSLCPWKNSEKLLTENLNQWTDRREWTAA